MKKAFATTALVTLLALSLSGCSFDLLKPGNQPVEPKPKHDTSEPAAPQPEDDMQVDDDTYVEDATNAGSGDVQSYFCEDGESLEVTNTNYASGILYVTGDCNAVTISADNVMVFIDSAVSVSVPSLYSTVDLASAVNDVTVTGDMVTMTGASAASVYVEGYANTITFNSADSVSVGGSENVVSWYGGAARGSDTGSDNTLLAP